MVCDNGWDMNDAQVVCRQLGCGTALAAPHSAYFGKGMDKIWVDNVNCTGMETYLTECPFSGFQTYSRSHSQDAGVICSGKEMLSIVTLACFRHPQFLPKTIIHFVQFQFSFKYSKREIDLELLLGKSLFPPFFEETFQIHLFTKFLKVLFSAEHGRR